MSDSPDPGRLRSQDDFTTERGIDRRKFLSAGAGVAAGVLLAGAGEAQAGHLGRSATPKPRRGGTLRVAVQGGGQAETLNPLASALDQASTCRSFQLYDWLTYLGPDLKPQMRLAQSIEPNRTGRVWTVRLRRGVEWHDGSDLIADDLIYTLRFLGDPKNVSNNRVVTSTMRLNALKKVDRYTVQIPLNQPIGDLVSIINLNALAVIKRGTTSFSKPIGTGPFKFKSFSPGQNSVFVRNPNYFVDGAPYVNELQILSIPDNTARLNALLTGAVDAIATIPFPQATQYLANRDRSPIRILVGNGPNMATFTLGCAHAPFNDLRVRQAMHLIVDRPQMLKQVFLGLGAIANDLYAPGYPYYASDIPQRKQDLEKAKSLLKQAGRDGMTVQLSSAAGTGGKLEAATLLAEQAKAAGITIQVLNLPTATYFSSVFPNYTFAQVNWQPTALATNYLQKALPTGPYNACQWNDPEATKLINQALRTPDAKKAAEIWHDVQEIYWARGPELMWGTSPAVDGVSRRLRGVVPSKAGVLNYWDFRNWWIS